MLLNSPIKKGSVAVCHDLLMAGLSFILALYLRLGENFAQSDSYRLPGLFFFISCCALSFLLFRTYRRSWRYTSSHDLTTLTKAATFSILLFLVVMFLFNRLADMPRSLMFINWFVLMALLGAPRYAYRILRDRTFTLGREVIPDERKIAVLLAGANNFAELFLRETVGNPYANYRIVGIVDNDPGKKSQYIRGVQVLGTLEETARIIQSLQKKGNAPQKIIIAPDLLQGAEVDHLLKVAEEHGLTLSRLPRLTDFSQTEASGIPLRPIALEDLLGRPQKALDRASMRTLIRGRKVLVTGAGGTIGGELARQIAGYEPARLTLLDSSEYSLYSITTEMEEKFPETPHRSVIGDIRNTTLLENLFAEEKQELVFHAAALKHVPLSESNACEASLTNVIGTKQLAEACVQAGVKLMVMISTDKAVHPSNVMGATKRLAERYIQAFGQSKKTGRTRFVTLRFGNVLGSTGSVIPLFQRQLAQGGPLTVTHKDITRYFMTVREAVELVLQAASISAAQSDSGSPVYVLDMGKPVRINDLAEQLIRLAGRKPHQDIAIEYTGLRPGEKLYEELFYKEENPQPTERPGILLASAMDGSLPEITKAVKKLEALATDYQESEVIALLKKILPEFQHSGKG